MNQGIQQYWREIRELEATLPEFVWIVSTDEHTPNFLTQVVAGVGAKLIRAKSHRLATDAEVEAHLANAAQQRKGAKVDRMRRSGAAVVVVNEVVNEVVDAADEPTDAPNPRRQR
jgi:hypothetical protein